MPALCCLPINSYYLTKAAHFCQMICMFLSPHLLLFPYVSILPISLIYFPVTLTSFVPLSLTIALIF